MGEGQGEGSTLPMNLLDFVWIFFIIASLQPVIKQRMLEVARVRLLRKIEEMRGSRVIVLIHRQETLSLLGFPISRYIDINDSEQVLRAIKLTDPAVPIDLILHTPGGLVLAAEQIALALCRHKARVTVLVPHYAMSGGTLLALAADEIVMDENAVLGPVDPQLGQFPAASIIKVVEQKKLDEIDDQTLIMADISRKAIRQVKAFVVDILKMNNVTSDKAEAIAEKLSTGTWTHDYPIGVSEARDLGLPVNAGLPKEVYDLMSLYPQAASRRPSVEYIPMPYPVAPREAPKRERS
jgi:ClpP class serine protease